MPANPKSGLPNPEFRPFKESDLDGVVAVEQQVFPMPWSRQSFLDCARWEEFWFRVAVFGKTLVGYFVAQIVAGEAELHNIAVDPAWQKQGIGKALMRCFLEETGKAGVKKIFLIVRSSNAAAIRLYEQFGFTFVNRRKGYYLDSGEDGLIYSLALAKPDAR